MWEKEGYCFEVAVPQCKIIITCFRCSLRYRSNSLVGTTKLGLEYVENSSNIFSEDSDAWEGSTTRTRINKHQCTCDTPVRSSCCSTGLPYLPTYLVSNCICVICSAVLIHSRSHSACLK